jgi:phthiocerol/phenolphthiocerol synthesis type-I polyketide synthase E
MGTDTSTEGEYVAPHTELEHELCLLWKTLTANDDIGITDRFLDVGGHSLLAANVVTWVRERYGVKLTLRWCFDHPTVAELAELIGAEHQDTASDRAGVTDEVGA